MSIEQREQVRSVANWGLKIMFAAIGWLLVNSFMEVKSDIRDIKTDIKSIDNRLIRVETKMEK